MLTMTMLFLISSTSIMNIYPLMIMMLTLSLWIYLMTMLQSNLSMTFNSLMYLDTLSSSLIMLTLLTTLLIFISSNSFKSLNKMLMSISIILTISFSMMDMLMFYIFFELVLIPTFLVVMKKGKQPERIQASIYLLLYTILASLPLLLGIFNMIKPSNFFFLSSINFHSHMALIFIMAFMVKLPMFLVHLWLPKAHVEAPLEGSMILAAVLLKLGGYGLIRFSPLIYKNMNHMSPWFVSISLVGASLTGMNCLRQKDIKALIAYSSVAHMALILTSIFTMKQTSISGPLSMMMAHGLSSSALFLMANEIYKQQHTRNIMTFKGMINTFPNLALWWFLFLAVNISAPPTLSMMSEIMIMSSMIMWNNSTMIFLMMSSMLTASFSILLYTSLTHSHNSLFLTNKTPKKKTFISLSLHLFPLIMLTLKSEITMM